VKLFSVSVGLLLAALGIFFVPVSFAVDGFGLVVNPGGVRTVRATDDGQVLHFPSQDGRFLPGQIVTALTLRDAVAKNALLEGTLHRELAKIETRFLDKHSKLFVDRERDSAKRDATVERLAAREELTRETTASLHELEAFTDASQTDIDSLNKERLEQLRRLEDLVKRSGEVSALPAQKLATMLDSIQSSRLAVINSRGAKFASVKKILDMAKGLNDLAYSNSIDTSEIVILTERLVNLDQQMQELDILRQSQRTEAAARYLAKAVLPQVALANGITIDMRTLQASRADVAKNDPLRLLATKDPAAGLSLLIYGVPKSGKVMLRHGDREITLTLPGDTEQMKSALGAAGIEVKQVHQDRQTIGALEVFSVFIELARDPDERLRVMTAEAYDDRDVPVMVSTSIILAASRTVRPEGTTNEIIGFLENRFAVILRPGQRVRGSINDTRTGVEIVFDAHLLDRDYATVDT